ncbi:hypothetical protein AYO45_04645 [Gammaproteobacteria bacterium SCGC AG-212-F23]|nr:hypothetical protein AYO45_04645 [Gammaproteobacteria bacterium SCGC AG-212-F23]
MAAKEFKVKVEIEATYLAHESSVKQRRFVWAYMVHIENQMDEILQLLGRQWKITDMSGHIEEIRGPGVVGLQPIIKPGKSFSYHSFCQLTTPQGLMEGQYDMQTLEDARFYAAVPKLVLSSLGDGLEEFRAKLH